MLMAAPEHSVLLFLNSPCAAMPHLLYVSSPQTVFCFHPQVETCQILTFQIFFPPSLTFEMLQNGFALKL